MELWRADKNLGQEVTVINEGFMVNRELCQGSKVFGIQKAQRYSDGYITPEKEQATFIDSFLMIKKMANKTLLNIY